MAVCTLGAQQIAQDLQPGAMAIAQGAYEFARDGIDEVIFRYFGLSSHEEILVRDMVDLVAKSLHPTSYAELHIPLQDLVFEKDVKAYISQLYQAFLRWADSRGGRGVLRVSRVDRAGDRTPLDVIHIALGETEKDVNREPP